MERVREYRVTRTWNKVSLYLDTNKQTIEEDFDSVEELNDYIESLELRLPLEPDEEE